MSISCAVLMCHAPIVVPEIAGARAPECAKTTAAMREAAEILRAHEPDLVVLTSPHTPRHRTRFGIVHDDVIAGSFVRFGHPALALSVPGAPEAARTLAACAAEAGLETHVSRGARELDHGALVPLWFVHEAGYRGPVLLIALPYPGTESERTFGAAIAHAAARLGQRWAVLASGDMSHRLLPGAPAGYHPDGAAFDAAFVAHLERGALDDAVTQTASLADQAAEDVLQSTAVAAGAVGTPRGLRVLAYEGPFGVGYCEALLSTAHAEPLPAAYDPAPPAQLADVARAAIAHRLANEPFTPPTLEQPWDAARAVFVTLRAPDGTLRGCIGRTQPMLRSLAEEVADCAVSAASRDHRVAPICEDELAGLQIEVSVLSPPEPVADAAALDPARYGVVVQQGSRRGVLLPGIEGIDSTALQLRIALRKAGIDEDAAYALQRFTVDKVLGAGSTSA